MPSAISPITNEFSQPYLTLAEFKSAPTGIDFDNLVIGGNSLAQDAELINAITRASSWIDQFCNQSLYAITTTERTRVRVGQDGMLRWQPDNFPIVALVGLSYGATPASLNAVADVSNAWLEDYLITYPISGLSISGIQSGFSLGSSGIGKFVYVQYSYVNGFANTALALSATIGASSITVVNPIGITAGQWLNIPDGANTENVQVSSSYVFGSTVIPLVASLLYAHASIVAISAMPAAIKQAAILMATVFLQTRGDQSLTMSIGSTGQVNQGVIGQINDNKDLAQTLLGTYRRTI